MTTMRMLLQQALPKKTLRFVVAEVTRTRLGLKDLRGRSYSTAISSEPLVLWLNNNNNHQSAVTISPSPPLLLPVRPPLNLLDMAEVVHSPESVLERVTDHYASSDHFVGGMGESDPGVWFAAASGTAAGDALESAELIQQSIELVKEERHGVPFGVYTTGLVTSALPLVDLGLDCLQVSLHGSTPKEYQQATGIGKNEAAKLFGTVCGFIVDAVEQGVAVEVSVRQEFAAATRDLALSLGARQVHVYP